MSDDFAPESPAVSVWPKSVRSVVLHVPSMARYAMAAARGWAANSINARVRLAAQNNGLRQEVELLREELRIKDAPGAPLWPQRSGEAHCGDVPAVREARWRPVQARKTPPQRSLVRYSEHSLDEGFGCELYEGCCFGRWRAMPQSHCPDGRWQAPILPHWVLTRASLSAPRQEQMPGPTGQGQRTKPQLKELSLKPRRVCRSGRSADAPRWPVGRDQWSNYRFAGH